MSKINRGALGSVRNALRKPLMSLRCVYLRKLWGMHIGSECMISFAADLDRANPRGIYIGDGTAISRRAVLLTHDFTRQLYSDVRIGRNCLIGVSAIVMPGVTIGDQCVIGPGSVVFGDIPPNSVVAGNPARPVLGSVMRGKWGLRVLESGA